MQHKVSEFSPSEYNLSPWFKTLHCIPILSLIFQTIPLYPTMLN